MEIEKEIDFVNEPEVPRFLGKGDVEAAGGMVFEFIKAVKIEATSKAGNKYDAIEITLRDDYGLRTLKCFREEMKFRGFKPKKVHISVEKVADKKKWVIKSNDTA